MSKRDPVSGSWSIQSSRVGQLTKQAQSGVPSALLETRSKVLWELVTGVPNLEEAPAELHLENGRGSG